MKRVSGMTAMARAMKGVDPAKFKMIPRSLFNLGAANKPALGTRGQKYTQGQTGSCAYHPGCHNHIQGLQRCLGKNKRKIV
jgi:hypothetical protein